MGSQVAGRRSQGLVLLGLALVLLAALAPSASAREGSRFRPAVESRLGVVATESPAAARVGRGVLESGGNAFDAAAATVFAVGVARPQSCGIGGGGFAVLRRSDWRVASIDFRETAPAAFTRESLQGPGLHEDLTGHLTVGVPGTVAGMDLLLRRFGTRTLAQALAPARRLARDGVRVTPALSASMAENAERLRLFPPAASKFLQDGQPYPAGAVLRQPLLARSMRLIAEGGPRVFYRGSIAQAIAGDMATASQRPGDSALMVRSDLARYRAKLRRPLVGSYRGTRVVTVPPPSSGGTTILAMLNILAGYDLAAMGQSSAGALHLIAEAQKLAWADRNAYVADPDKVRVPTAGLIDPAYGAQRRAHIDPLRAQPQYPGRPGGATPPSTAKRTGDNRRGSTTHISVIDRRGNAIALTCTIEQEFGSAVVAPGTGILLNNEMTDFGDPGSANEAGPGKRPRSSMAPTILLSGQKPVLVAGGAGGARIIMGVLHAIVNTVDFDQDLAHAVDAERSDTPTGEMTIEDTRVDASVLDELVARGHVLERVGEYDERPRVQAAGVDRATGLRLGVSDSRTEDGTLGQRRSRTRR